MTLNNKTQIAATLLAGILANPTVTLSIEKAIALSLDYADKLIREGIRT